MVAADDEEEMIEKSYKNLCPSSNMSAPTSDGWEHVGTWGGMLW